MTVLERVRSTAGQLRRRFVPGGLILMYHRIAELPSDPWSLAVTPKHFADHLDVIKRLARPTSLARLTAALGEQRRPCRDVVVTFDDGYADNLYAAKPLLDRAGVPATVFVISDSVGGTEEFWWDELERIILTPGRLPATLRLALPEGEYAAELGGGTLYSAEEASRHRGWRVVADQDPTPRHALYRALWSRLQPLPEPGRRPALAALREWAGTEQQAARPTHRTLTAGEIADLADGGLVEIGGHGATHAPLTALPPEAQREDVARCKHDLEAIVGMPLRSFAYPHGLYTAETCRLVCDCGYEAACATGPSAVRRGSDLYRLPRVMVKDWRGKEFARRLTAWMRSG